MPAAQKSAPKWRLTALVCKHLGPHLPPTIRGQHKNAPNGGVGGTKRGAKWWGARGIRKEGKGDPKAMCGWGGVGRGGEGSTGSLWRRARARGPRALWVEGGGRGGGAGPGCARAALPLAAKPKPYAPITASERALLSVRLRRAAFWRGLRCRALPMSADP